MLDDGENGSDGISINQTKKKLPLKKGAIFVAQDAQRVLRQQRPMRRLLESK